jgi:hypothetical protein
VNHKRGRPKNRRAGCLFCKPHKANGAKNRELPRDVRRTEPRRTTDHDDEYAGYCDSLCRCWESDYVFDYEPPSVTFTLQEVAR